MPSIPTQSTFTYPNPNPSASPSFTQDDTSESFIPEPSQPMPTFSQPTFSQPAFPQPNQSIFSQPVFTFNRTQPTQTSTRLDCLEGNSSKKVGGTTAETGNTIVHPPVSLDEHVAVQRENKVRTFYGLKAAASHTHILPFHRMLPASGSKLNYSNQQSIVPSFSQTSGHSDNIMECVLHSFVAENEPDQEMIYEDFDQVDQLEMEELDLKWQMAMLSLRINRFKKKAGRKMNYNNQQPARFDRRKVRCYKCLQLGHFARECNVKTVDDKARYSAFKVTEVKTDEPKALVSVDSMVNWSDHAAENKRVKVRNYLDELEAGLHADNGGADASEAAAEFAMMGISPKVQNCPLGTVEEINLFTYGLSRWEMNAVPLLLSLETYMPTPYDDSETLCTPVIQASRPKTNDFPLLLIFKICQSLMLMTKFHCWQSEFAASVTAGGSDPAASRNTRPAVNSADRPNPAGWSKRPATVSAGRPVSAGWLNPAARPYFRPSSVYFNNMYWPDLYDPMYMNKGRWGTAVKTSAGSSQNWLGSLNGLSRSMTGNKKKLDDFVQIKGRALSNLVVEMVFSHEYQGKSHAFKDFKALTLKMLYVEELQHFNLFSVSQICDKKNKVLFTDTDCLVLSEEFQLPDESQVVLRIPRNMISTHIQHLRPATEQKVTCLVAKRFLSESTTDGTDRMAHVKLQTITRIGHEWYFGPLIFNDSLVILVIKTDKLQVYKKLTYLQVLPQAMVLVLWNAMQIMQNSLLALKKDVMKLRDGNCTIWDPAGIDSAGGVSGWKRRGKKLLLVVFLLLVILLVLFNLAGSYDPAALGDPAASTSGQMVFEEQEGCLGIVVRNNASWMLRVPFSMEKLKKRCMSLSLKALKILTSQACITGVVKVLYGLHQATSCLVNLNECSGKRLEMDLILRSMIDSPFQLEAYSDSDYAGSHGDRKSTTGGCQFLGRRLISWQCKKQTIVATSSTEAEYVAAASCCAQVLWIQNQLLDYGFNFMNTKIFIDNQSTICIVKNPVFHQRTKHIEIRHHFIRDANEKNLIQVLKIHTDDNVADLLTKAFDGPRFEYLVVHIGMVDMVLISAGSTMILLVVILSAGCFVSAGSYGLCCWFRVHAGGHTSAGGFISADRVFVYAVNTSFYAAELVCAGSIMFLLAELFLLVVSIPAGVSMYLLNE
ncbi:putative ribonuclease H-like domain-containing protein [Tanacetum coccineum]